MQQDRVRILLVDDQIAKLLSYESVLKELDEELLRASSAREALGQLLTNDIAVILLDVSMPDLDGFQLAEMIRNHPRFKSIGIIFVSAVQMTDFDRLRGYQLGAVDYVPVPVIPELLRAKVRVFVELFRKTRQLEKLNAELEERVNERTAQIANANARLTSAIEVAQLGTWDWDFDTGVFGSRSHGRMHGDLPDEAERTVERMLQTVHPEDRAATEAALQDARASGGTFHRVHRVLRPGRSHLWCEARGRCEFDTSGRPIRMVGVTMDVTEQKSAAERQHTMMQELHHRVRNSLSTVQAIASLARRTATDIESFHNLFSSRVVSLGRTHTLLLDREWNRIDLREILASELGGYLVPDAQRVSMSGPAVHIQSQLALSLGLVIHELASNAAKFGAWSVPTGTILIRWALAASAEESGDPLLDFRWQEKGGPAVAKPARSGFGTNLLNGLFNEQSGSSLNMNFDPAGFELHLLVPSSLETSLASPAKM